jgi:hypothetical protein
MAEWLKAAVLKTASREPGRGFESYSLRHEPLINKTLSAWRYAHSVKKTGEMPERPKGLAC